MSREMSITLNDIIKDIRWKMRDITRELCYGCQIDHPSQREHDLCLMASDKDRFEATFDIAWNKLSPEKYPDWLTDSVRSIVSTRITDGYDADTESEEEMCKCNFYNTYFLYTRRIMM